MDLDLLPPLYLARDRRGSDSGRLHSPVRDRFEQGDSAVLEAVRLWAGYTDQARQALESHDGESLAELLNANFDLRRRIYGDAALGERNLLMVETLRGLGLPAQFAGSGGAVLSFSKDTAQMEAARDALQDLGFEFALLTPAQYERAHAAPD
jgi:glucuronokinase